MNSKTCWLRLLNLMTILIMLSLVAGQWMLAASSGTGTTFSSHAMSVQEEEVLWPTPIPLTQQPGWEWQNPLPQGNTLNAVWGSGPNDVFAVGDVGTILHYDGSKWTAMESGTTLSLTGVWGSSGSDVFAVGQDDGMLRSGGIILHYDGDTWRPVNPNSEIIYYPDLFGIWGNNSSDVFVVGGSRFQFECYGFILHYDGSQWREMMPDPAAGTLVGVWGSSGRNVFAIGIGKDPDPQIDVCTGSDVILHYDGNSWRIMNDAIANTLRGIWGSGPNNVFAVGDEGTILQYDGAAWRAMRSGTTSTLGGIWGSGPNDVFAVGGSGIILHYDGNEWAPVNTEMTYGLSHVWGSSGSDVFIVGRAGSIIHYDGHAWRRLNSSVTSSQLSGVWGSSGNDVFAVGSSGAIVHYDGSRWDVMSSGTTQSLHDVWGSSGNDVFAVGDEGTIQHYDGAAWRAMRGATTHALYGIWGSGPDNVFAVGDEGAIQHYDGTAWRAMRSTTTYALHGIWGSGPNNIFVVGDGGFGEAGPLGLVLRYDGSAWHQMDADIRDNLHDVWGSSRNDVFAVGGGAGWGVGYITSYVVHYDGDEWREIIDEYKGHPLGSVWHSGPSDVFALGSGRILHYDGHAWRMMKSNIGIQSVWGSGPDDVFIVGGGGVILHYGEQTHPPSDQATDFQITRVSVASDGTQGDSNSRKPAISADGRYVAFDSSASNLVEADNAGAGDTNGVTDTNGVSDVFVHDRQTGQTVRVSVASDGTEGNGTSSIPSISADGRYVVFESSASNLVSTDTNGVADTNGVGDIFVHDRETGQTTRVSVASDGTEGNHASGSGGVLVDAMSSISADGRYVAFQSRASNLVSGDTNTCDSYGGDDPGWPCSDIFVHDRETGQTTRVSVASDGTQANKASYSPSISGDGRYVTFHSWASNLLDIPLYDWGLERIYLHDRQTGQTTLVSVADDGAQAGDYSWDANLSADGRYVAFVSKAYNLVGDGNQCVGAGGGVNCPHVYVHDQETGSTSRVSVSSDGAQAIDGYSVEPSLSADGRYVAFSSYASNLVDDDTNNVCEFRQQTVNCYDIFVHDRGTGQTVRISLAAGDVQGNAESHVPSISADGRYVAFASEASNLVSGDTNGALDIFVVDLAPDDEPAVVPLIARAPLRLAGIVGEEMSVEVHVQNDGDAALTGATLTISTSGAILSAHDVPPIDAGQSTKLTLPFTPSSKGESMLVLELMAGAHADSRTIPLEIEARPETLTPQPALLIEEPVSSPPEEAFVQRLSPLLIAIPTAGFIVVVLAAAGVLGVIGVRRQAPTRFIWIGAVAVALVVVTILVAAVAVWQIGLRQEWSWAGSSPSTPHVSMTSAPTAYLTPTVLPPTVAPSPSPTFTPSPTDTPLPTDTPTPTRPASCPGAPPQQVQVGARAEVCTAYDRLTVRAQPQRSSAEVTRLEPGAQVTVVDGPVCADNWSWWKVQTDLGAVGWVAEGGDEVDPYFICPVR